MDITDDIKDKEVKKLDIMFSVLINFVMNISVFRNQYQIENNKDVNKLLLCINSDNSLMVGVIRWCNVFGTNNEDNHWTKLVTEHYHDAIRNILYEICGGEHGWKNYWEQMLYFRNNYVSHYNKEGFKNKVPFLDNALEISFKVTDYIKEQYALYGFDLRDYYNNIEETEHFGG